MYLSIYSSQNLLQMPRNDDEIDRKYHLNMMCISNTQILKRNNGQINSITQTIQDSCSFNN